MIIQTSRISRSSGVDFLARHLLDKVHENERIEILAGDRAALHDAQALSSAKRCRFSVRHLSISPQREMTPAQLREFLRMVDAEFRIGPSRPRLLVRHIKKGRSHFHVAVAEVDPITFRVLDCRHDFARLEAIARRYEAVHAETLQPTRAERRASKTEGFSNIARKRAERTLPGFDRTQLRDAFARGAAAFRSELEAQRLYIAGGRKGAILATAEGIFVAAANRAVGVKRNQFQKFMEEIGNELIGTQREAPADLVRGRKHHSAAPQDDRGGKRARSGSAAHHDAWSDPGRPARTGRGASNRGRTSGSAFAEVAGRLRREQYFLSRLTKLDLDDLLRRAEEMASWILSAFEPPARRLTRQVEEAKRLRELFPPADAPAESVPTYSFRRRVTR